MWLAIGNKNNDQPKTIHINNNPKHTHRHRHSDCFGMVCCAGNGMLFLSRNLSLTPVRFSTVCCCFVISSAPSCRWNWKNPLSCRGRCTYCLTINSARSFAHIYAYIRLECFCNIHRAMWMSTFYSKSLLIFAILYCPVAMAPFCFPIVCDNAECVWGINSFDLLWTFVCERVFFPFSKNRQLKRKRKSNVKFIYYNHVRARWSMVDFVNREELSWIGCKSIGTSTTCLQARNRVKQRKKPTFLCNAFHLKVTPFPIAN